MKRIITLFFALATISLSFAQSNAEIKQLKRSAHKTNIKLGQENITMEPRSVDCIWESDFTDASDWDLDHDSSDCSLDWEIGENLECGGFYPISPIESADGFYAMLDSDEYGGEEGGTETEDSWLTMANPVDLSDFDNVVVEIDTWYQSYNLERCFLVVSTDGTFPTNLDPTTTANPAEGIYELFPDLSGEVQANTGNPAKISINISEAAGGEEQVWVRFNWTGTWGYAWFIDNVCIAEQPADDIALNYGVVSHNGTGEEYGRVPTSQIVDDVNCAGQVFNFGSAAQNNVELTMTVTDSDGYDVTTETFGEDEMYGFDDEGFLDTDDTIEGPVASGQNVYFSKDVDMSGVSEGIYTATFNASSDGDSEGGEYNGDNEVVREFSFTENEYSTDGIDVYSNLDVTRMGTGSFTDGADGFMMFSYYDIAEEQEIYGAKIMLDTYAYSEEFCDEFGCTVAGGECILTLRDTTLIPDFAGDTYFEATDILTQSDFYVVTQADVDQGFMIIPFLEPYTASPEAYMIGLEMYSNGNANDTYILDDETVPQPFYMSMIYIPGDQVYSNGNANGIRMIMGEDSGGLSIDERISNFNVYPNPSKGILNIEINESDSYIVKINDIIGKLVSEEKIYSNTTLDLNTLDKGVYFVNISNNETQHITKVVIE